MVWCLQHDLRRHFLGYKSLFFFFFADCCFFSLLSKNKQVYQTQVFTHTQVSRPRHRRIAVCNIFIEKWILFFDLHLSSWGFCREVFSRQSVLGMSRYLCNSFSPDQCTCVRAGVALWVVLTTKCTKITNYAVSYISFLAQSHHTSTIHPCPYFYTFELFFLDIFELQSQLFCKGRPSVQMLFSMGSLQQRSALCGEVWLLLRPHPIFSVRWRMAWYWVGVLSHFGGKVLQSSIWPPTWALFFSLFLNFNISNPLISTPIC